MNNSYFVFPDFDPKIFSIGAISFHWYGLMYVIAFIFARWLALRRCNKYGNNWSSDQIEKLLSFCFIGVFLGGRIGYILIYNFQLFLNNPLYLFEIWNGGMSFHGGLIGVIIAMKLFAHRTNRTFFQISDFVAPLIPFGLGAGRLGNFINGELWGRVTLNSPFATLFHNSYHQDMILATNNIQYQSIINSYGSLPRHPSQLYELFLEGIVLFVILNTFISYKLRYVGKMSGLFLLNYGIFRTLVEFYREPDPQIGLFNSISMGQILSIPMIILGIIVIINAYRNNYQS